MAKFLFADESGMSPSEPCYSIGVLVVPETSLDDFDKEFARLVEVHGVVGEVRWTKVAKSHGLMNLSIDLFRYVLRSELCFNSIVVLKKPYRKWQSGALDEAFYTTYGILLGHCLKGQRGDYLAFIDDRSEAYGKHDEALQIVTNRMLDKIAAPAKLVAVNQSDSKKHLGIQAADMLTGAIKAAHHLFLDPNCPLSAGKRLLLDRLAATLGWDALHYDTWPNQEFNIWHFPLEYRARPRTVELRPNYDIPYVTATELARRYDTVPTTQPPQRQ